MHAEPRKIKPHFEVTQADINTARAVGAKGTQLLEFAIHRTLDEHGVPREGRYVKATYETITMELPDGWELEFAPIAIDWP